MSALDDILHCQECESVGAARTSVECHGCGTIQPHVSFAEAREELAALRANQLDPKIAEAVRAYQRVWLELDAIAPGIELRFSPELQALQVLMEADAKAGGAR